jgi:hypothetical protein
MAKQQQQQQRRRQLGQAKTASGFPGKLIQYSRSS